MVDIISNVIVGIVILLCIAAAVWVLGLENGWFARDKKDKKEEEDDG